MADKANPSEVRAEPVSKGLTLPCPKCGEADACISLHLDDMETLTCRECDAEFTVEEVTAFIARWQPVLTWIASAPTQETP